MKKILAISNSFGVDATRYLHDIAKNGGKEVKVVALYIGGCSLKRHYDNMISGAKAYEVHSNGVFNGEFAGIEDSLLSDEWDIVTLQQASPVSGDESSYFPYIEELSAFVKKHAPNAKQYMHQTWAYPEGSKIFEVTPDLYKTREQMIPFIKNAYSSVAKKIGAVGIIPSLEIVELLYKELGREVYRDDLHVSFGLGRYALGCVWYGALFNKNPEAVDFCLLDEPCDEQKLALARKLSAQVCREYGYID